MSEPTYQHIIAGAGCAGLSLAWHLLDAGCTDQILLIDSRRHYVNDRTWCYWQVEPTPFDDLADYSWNSWEIHAHPNLSAVGSCARYPYLHLRSDAFYERVFERLAASPQVTILLGESLLGFQRDGELIRVETTCGSYRGRQVFDSLGMISRREMAATQGSKKRWLQHFLGQHIRVRRPVFELDRIRLMDHRVDQARGPHFMYLLPFSTTTALIENTYFFNTPLSACEHREEIARYLAESYDLGRDDYEVLREESGRIPMGVRQHWRTPDEGIIPIGIPGGAARAATGYAFLRIQRQSREIARRIVTGRDLRTGSLSFAEAKYMLFDRILLAALAKSPEMAPTFFTTLFKRANAGSVVRFLTEKSTLVDDLEVVTSLLRPDLLRMILHLS